MCIGSIAIASERPRCRTASVLRPVFMGAYARESAGAVLLGCAHESNVGAHTMTERDRRTIETVKAMHRGDASVNSVTANDIVWHVPNHNLVSGEDHGDEQHAGLMPAGMAPLDRREFEFDPGMGNGD